MLPISERTPAFCRINIAAGAGRKNLDPSTSRTGRIFLNPTLESRI